MALAAQRKGRIRNGRANPYEDEGKLKKIPKGKLTLSLGRKTSTSSTTLIQFLY